MRELALALALVLAGSSARAQTPDDDEDPWLSGPEVPLVETTTPNPAPPRESSDAVEPLNPPPYPPDPWVVRTPPLLAPDEDLRFHTVLTREDLWRFGDLTLTDPLVVVPGLHLPSTRARGELPHMRGLSQEHVQVRLDGIPLVSASTWPQFPLLGMLDPEGVLRVVVRHGPRLEGISGNTAAGGALHLESVPPPVELGEGVALAGSLRGGYGGPDLEKVVLVGATTGLGRVRVAVTAGAFDTDDLALGRGAGLLPSSDVLGGHLGARVDVAPHEGMRAFAAWRSARHGDNPYPTLCVPDDNEVRDCTFVRERALDLLYAGLDADDAVFGWHIGSRLRAHAQHLGEKTEKSGRAVVSTEIADDFAFRAGALGDLTVTPPRLPLFGGGLATQVHGTAELTRDRVVSLYGVRSRRLRDALTEATFLDDPTRASGLDDSLVDAAALGLKGRAGFSFLTAELGVRLLQERLHAPAGRASRIPPPALDEEALSLSAELALRAQLLEELSVFLALTRSQRGDTLFARTLGPQQLVTSPAPALLGASAFEEHGGEVGAGWSLAWLETEGVLYAARRTGPLTVGVDERDDNGVARLIARPDRTVLGVEGRVRYRTGVDGLTGLATLAALAIDEGELLGENPSVPASGVTPPFGVLVLDYQPSSSLFGAFARLRYALPHARLSPAEEDDPTLCPEGIVEPQAAPCRGTSGIGLIDLGASLSPSERLRLDALVENVLDAPWRLHGHPLPGGGLGARLTLTLLL